MKTMRHYVIRALVTLGPLSTNVGAAMAQAPDSLVAPPAAQPAQPAPGMPGAPGAPDGKWPKTRRTEKGTLIMYQPQVQSWEKQKHIVALAALAFTPPGGKAALGTVKMESATQVAMNEGLVRLTKLNITEANFPGVDREVSRKLIAELNNVMPKTEIIIALDRVMAAMERSEIKAGSSLGINTEAPPIFVSENPAVIVQFDGEPTLGPISGSKLQFVVNTNWDVFKDDKDVWYLRYETGWLKTKELSEKWEPAGDLPEAFEKLPDDGNWADVKANVPGKKIKKDKMPIVFVTEKPSELIVIDGKPKYEKIKDTDLQWVKNTESDLWRHDGKTFYFLVSGRWFKASSFKGPWTFATPSLPPDFKAIPEDHERSRVLASVPGTDAAAEAMLLAQIPQTARVNRKEVKPPEVEYAGGTPQWKDIEESPVDYAENTANTVLKLGDLYYMCFQGVWFASKNPNGPWEVTTDVPDEIYEIPANSPVHNVTYVVVDEEDSDDDYAAFAFTAGYSMGIMISYGCCMWGSGYYYPPYMHHPIGYPPYYYPYPPSYGAGAIYNPRTGAYGYRQGVYGPYGGATRGATYNPRTGTYARGGKAWGPSGGAGWAEAYNPRTGAYGKTAQGRNPYGSWGTSHVQKGDDWVRTARVSGENGSKLAWESSQGSGRAYRGEEGFVGQRNGDIYAGKDGNVYKKGEDGWQSWNGEGWNDVPGAGNLPADGNRPGGGNGASQLPAGGDRPGAGTADRPSQLPAGGDGASVGTNDRPGAGTSDRPSAGTSDRSAGTNNRAGNTSQPTVHKSRPSSNTMNDLNKDYRSRQSGNQRSQSYGSRSSGSRGGGMRGGGGRGGGGRRR